MSAAVLLGFAGVEAGAAQAGVQAAPPAAHGVHLVAANKSAWALQC